MLLRRARKDLTVRLEGDMSAVGINLERWRKAAHKAGRRFRWVNEGEESFMRKQRMIRRTLELQSDTRKSRQRHPQASLRGGGRGGGVVERGEGRVGDGGRVRVRKRSAQETEGWAWPSSS